MCLSDICVRCVSVSVCLSLSVRFTKCVQASQFPLWVSSHNKFERLWIFRPQWKLGRMHAFCSVNCSVFCTKNQAKEKIIKSLRQKKCNLQFCKIKFIRLSWVQCINKIKKCNRNSHIVCLVGRPLHLFANVQYDSYLSQRATQLCFYHQRDFNKIIIIWH